MIFFRPSSRLADYLEASCKVAGRRSRLIAAYEESSGHRKQESSEEDAAMTKKLKPMHPGEVLREEFLVPP